MSRSQQISCYVSTDAYQRLLVLGCLMLSMDLFMWRWAWRSICEEDAGVLRGIATSLHQHLQPWAETKPPVILPHVSLFKISWVPNDKKSKSASAATARQLKMHKEDWSEASQEFNATVQGAPICLFELHPGGGASMGNDRHLVAWNPSTDRSPAE